METLLDPAALRPIRLSKLLGMPGKKHKRWVLAREVKLLAQTPSSSANRFLIPPGISTRLLKKEN